MANGNNQAKIKIDIPFDPTALLNPFGTIGGGQNTVLASNAPVQEPQPQVQPDQVLTPQVADPAQAVQQADAFAQQIANQSAAQGVDQFVQGIQDEQPPLEPTAPSANLPDPDRVTFTPAPPLPSIPVQEPIPQAVSPTQEVGIPTPQQQAEPPSIVPKATSQKTSSQQLLEFMLQGNQKNELQQKIEDRFVEKQNLRKQTVDALQRSLNQVEQQQPSMVPHLRRGLALFSDAFFATDLAKNVKPGESAQERENRINQLRLALSQEQGALSDSEIDLLKARSGADGDTLKLFNALRRGEQFSIGRRDKIEGKFKDTINKGVIDPLTKAAPKLDQIQSALDSRNFRRINAVLSVFAREVNQERGALSDTDVARTIFPDIIQRVSTASESIGIEGKISEANLIALKDALSDYRSALANATREKLVGLKTISKIGNSAFLFKDKGVGTQIFKEVDKQIQRVATPKKFKASQKRKSSKTSRGLTDAQKKARTEELLRKARGN